MCFSDFSNDIVISNDFLMFSKASSGFGDLKIDDMALNIICRRHFCVRLPMVCKGSLFSIQGLWASAISNEGKSNFVR
jgi:hypothetical protein